MKRFVILIPLYNDWKSVFELLKNIDLQIAKWNASVSVLIVNDASIEKKPKTELNFKNIKSVRIINMKNNRGHDKMLCDWTKIFNGKEKILIMLS